MKTENVTTLLVPAHVLRVLNAAANSKHKKGRRKEKDSPSSRLYTRQEISEIFHVDEYTILRWTRLRMLKSVKLPGSRRLYFMEEGIKERIEKWLANQS